MKFINVETIPLSPEKCVTGFGKTLIVAPHADDESLGCGGVISLLRKYGQGVFMLLLTDGTLSHPNSAAYPTEKLRELREGEFTHAAKILGVAADNLIFCRLKDRSVPTPLSAQFPVALKEINRIMSLVAPKTVFVPWRRDPHPDHKAAYQLISHAKKGLATVYEYPIWLDELGDTDDAPTLREVTPVKLDISHVLDKKLAAIAAHRSQTTNLITDDPSGFTLPAKMLATFNKPYEIFFIEN